MQRDEQATYSPALPTGGRLIKRPFPFHKIELAEIDQDHPLDLPVRPTTRVSLLEGRGITRERDFSLSPEDYQVIDEQIADDLDLSNMSTVHLMQLSGLMQAVSTPMPAIEIKRTLTGSIPAVKVQDGQITLDQQLPNTEGQAQLKAQPKWRQMLSTPLAKGVIGLLVGAVIILLMSRLINFTETAHVIAENLTTLPGILHTVISGVAFATAFSLRGARWKLFLSRIQNVSFLTAIRIFWIGVFLNFILPVQGGELAKSVMLKRTTGIPVSQSLPTVAMDKALDLMPVLFIIAIVPFIPGIHMNITLWLILTLVGGILIGMIVVMGLMVWKRSVAMALIHFFLRFLPKGLGQKIEGFAMGFINSLLEGASRPQSFIPALMLTALAVLCEGIFAWEGFQAVGQPMNLGIAIFGYTVYTMFSILPNPPAGVGTNEGAKIVVFVTLLGFNSVKVNAMAILVHLVCVILIPSIGLISLRTLGLSLSSLLNRREQGQEEARASA